MDDVALANYVIGINAGPVEAGHVDSVLADLLSVPVGTPIWFSDYTLLKLHEKHGEITFQHYRYMPKLLLLGFAAPSSKRARHVELWWLDERASAAFLAVLKATHRDEVFVGTFHPLHRREARRLAKKATKDKRLVRSQRGFEDFRKI